MLHAAEQGFYSHYSWCLNPALTVADLFQRLCRGTGPVPDAIRMATRGIESQPLFICLCCRMHSRRLSRIALDRPEAGFEACSEAPPFC